MRENTSFTGTGWLRGRRRNPSVTRESATHPHLQRINGVSPQRGRSREVGGNKTPPRARTWSPKPSIRLETRLGITPTRYAVDELYIGQSPEIDIEDDEDPTTDDISSQGSSVLFMEDRHSLYKNVWEESEGLIAKDDGENEASQLVAPKRTPPFRRKIAADVRTPSPKGLFRRKPDSQRRAREIIDKAYSRDSMPVTPCSSTGSLTSLNSISSCVEIFLLLIEPKSKVFELIELSYPRRTTTIAKILKMIPKNVSDPVLSEQKYVGLCRPKKNSEPITELKALASNSVTSSGPTANICQGDIFIAIPANTSSRQMVHLAKPIVANPHIQNLMSNPNHQTPKLVKRRATTKDSTCTASTCASVTPVVDETPVSNTRTPTDKQLVNRDIFCSEEADAYFQYCEQEMKRAVAQANFDNGSTPLRSKPTHSDPPSLVSRQIAVHEHDTERSSDDTASYEGSAVSSFHSMMHSVGSVKPRTIVVNQRTVLLRKRRVARQVRLIRRLGLIFFSVSVVYYFCDSTRLDPERLQAIDRPLGFKALLPTLITLIVLVKLQRFYLIPAQSSMCPVMQAIATQMTAQGSSSQSPLLFK